MKPRAAQVSVDPTGLVNVTSDDVQGAIEDLDAAAGTYTDEQVRDVMGTALVAGSGISITPNDGADTITVTNTGGGVGSGANNVGRDTELLSSAYTTITLDSTPVTNGEQVFLNGVLLSATADYTISGAVITLTSTVYTGSRVTVVWQTTNSTPGGMTMGGSPPSPTLRGSNIAFVNNTNTVTLALPSGTVVGDRAIMFAGHGFVPALPAGWSSLDATNGSNWNGAVFTKIIDATDVTNGTVTCTFSGSFQGEVALAVAVGTTAGVRETKTVRSSTGGTGVSLTTTSSATGTDLALYFGSIRASSSTTTVDRGTSLQSRAADTNASAALYSEDLTSSGTVTAVFSHSVTTSGYYEAIVILKGA